MYITFHFATRNGQSALYVLVLPYVPLEYFDPCKLLPYLIISIGIMLSLLYMYLR